MVTRSIDNWEQHKQDVYEWAREIAGEDKATKFINFYAGRYDKFGRSFISYKAAWLLFDDYNLVSKSGIRWYAIVGEGGSGKTTVAKNMAYFLDPLFSVNEVKTEMDDIILKFKDLWNVPLRAMLLDEPDLKVSAISKKGKLVRSILGKSRKQKKFMLYCATDLDDIPNYIYKKISCVIFTPYLGKAWLFKSKSKELDWVVSDIKRVYNKKGFHIFTELRKSKGFLSFDTIKNTPLTAEDEEIYGHDKDKALMDDIDRYLGVVNGKDNDPVVDKIVNLRDKGLTHMEISKEVGYCRSRVTQILGNKL